MPSSGLLLALLLRFFGALPLRMNRMLGLALGALLLVVPNRQRRIAQRNIELCFPPLSLRQRRVLLRAHLLETGKGLAELGLFWHRPSQTCLGWVQQIHGHEVFQRALASGKGVLLAAPHLGAWELLCLYLSAQAPCAFLYRELKRPAFERIVRRGRGRLGADLVKASARGVRQLYRALAQGAVVGILPDQQPKAGQGLFAPFFGVDALTMVLFSRLAQRSGSEVVFAWVERLPGARGYALHFSSPDALLSQQSLSDSVAALNRTVEHCVRSCPSQYQWGYKRFSIRPDDQPSLY